MAREFWALDDMDEREFRDTKSHRQESARQEIKRREEFANQLTNPRLKRLVLETVTNIDLENEEDLGQLNDYHLKWSSFNQVYLGRYEEGDINE